MIGGREAEEIGNNRSGVWCDFCKKKYEWAYVVGNSSWAIDFFGTDKGKLKCVNCCIVSDKLAGRERYRKT